MNYSECSAEVLEKRLLALWNEADMLLSNSDRYDEILDEVLSIRAYCRERHIKLDASIEARF